jgi:hypothetical protein
MNLKKKLLVGFGVALMFGAGAANAEVTLNQVSAFMVMPVVVGGPGIETYVTITNTGVEDVIAHVSYINGDFTAFNYCYECDFDVPLTGFDTEVLVLRNVGGITNITSEDGTVATACGFPFGFLTVNIEDPSQPANTDRVLTDNILVGSEVVVNYSAGWAFSVPAVSIRGDMGNGDRVFKFDGNEYNKLPRHLAADYIAPDFLDASGIDATLFLFTLGFERQFPPLVDCSVNGYDAEEQRVSASFQFGCWGFVDVCAISPEFCYPFLSQDPDRTDTHGWLHLSCRTDPDGDWPFSLDNGPKPFVDGGVHGLILQTGLTGSIVRRNDPTAPALSNSAAWARLLYQSVTAGDAVSLHLEAPGGGLS